MATKPVVKFWPWASDTNFESGAKDGQPTKTASSDPDQGFVSGTPVEAQEMNYNLDNIGDWLDWNEGSIDELIAALAALDSSDIANGSTVTGATVTNALQTLAAAITAIVSSATPANVSSSAGSAGVSTSAARADHVHQITFAVVNAVLSVANAAISVNSQKITNLATPTAGGDATNKTYVDALASNTVAQAVSSSSGSAGVSTGLARVDHVHALTESVVRAVLATSAAPVGINNKRLTDVAIPTLSNDVATKGYVDGLISGTLGLSDTAPVNVTAAAAAAGTAPAAARQDHKHNISTAAANTAQVGSIAAVGTSSSLARADHVHAFGRGTPVDIGMGNLPGVDTDFAAADHVHALTEAILRGVAATLTTALSVNSQKITNVAAPTVGSDVANKTYVDTAVAGTVALSNATPSLANRLVGDPGVSTNASRADHSHTVATAIPSALTVGGTNAVGSAMQLAAADHVHQISRGTPVAIGTANASGTAATFAGSDHVHALTESVLRSVAATLTAALSVNSQRITNVAAPSAGGDAANKTYVDGLASNTVPMVVSIGTGSAGSSAGLARADHVHQFTEASLRALLTMVTNVLSVNGQRITNVAAPTAGSDVTNKTYVDGAVTALLSNATPQQVTTSSGSPGGSSLAARADHSHQWVPQGNVVYFQPGYSGSDPNTYSTWSAAIAAALACGTDAKIVFIETSTPFSINASADGLDRISLEFRAGLAGNDFTINVASGVELTRFAAVEHFGGGLVLWNVSGSSSNDTVFIQATTSLSFRYRGWHEWTMPSRTSAIRATSGGAFLDIEDLRHSGSAKIRFNTGGTIQCKGTIELPNDSVINGASGTLNVRQFAGRGGLRQISLPSWIGSIVHSVENEAYAQGYTAADATKWPEGNPAYASDALDKLAARNWGEPAFGVRSLTGVWHKLNEGGDSWVIQSDAEHHVVWIPQYNYWMMLGFTSYVLGDRDYGLNLRWAITESQTRLKSEGWGMGSSSKGTISTNAMRHACSLVIPNGSGVRIVVSAPVNTASATCVWTSDNGGQSWTNRTGPFGSTNLGFGDMVWTGTHIIGISLDAGTTIGRSSNGVTWTGVTVASGTYRQVVSDGNGTVLIFATSTCLRSTNHGSSWSSAISLPGTVRGCVWLENIKQFVCVNTSNRVYRSSDGATWSDDAIVWKSPHVSTNSAELASTLADRARRSLVVHGDVILGLFRNDAASYGALCFSADGVNWHSTGALDISELGPMDARSHQVASSTPKHPNCVQTPIHEVIVQPDDEIGGSTWNYLCPVTEWRGSLS